MTKSKIRFVFMVLLGIVISMLLDVMIKNKQIEHHRIIDFFISIIITILVWEGNLHIDNLMNVYFPWEKKPGKRVLFHLLVSLFFSAFVIYLSMLAFNKYACPIPETSKNTFMISALVLGVLISIIILSIEISTQFFSNWKKSLIEVEKYKAESVQAQLQNLKNQLNPHFLFNNLSVLSSLVYIDQDKAVDFINQLSKVYRYLLDNRNSELVTLDNELTFIHSYTYLLKIRFDKNIVFNIDIPKDKLNLLLPPMSIQMLIENAIKHNEISNEMPLIININLNNEMLEVSNNIQLRLNSEPSSKTGLQNIKDRYYYFTDKVVEVFETSGSFVVKLPLLLAK